MKNNTSTLMDLFGFTCVLATWILIVLKLCKIITWSWLWVFAPYWGGLGIVILGVTVFGLYVLIRLMINK